MTSIKRHAYLNLVKIMKDISIVIIPMNVNVHLIMMENTVKNPLIYAKQHHVQVFAYMINYRSDDSLGMSTRFYWCLL